MIDLSGALYQMTRGLRQVPFMKEGVKVTEEQERKIRNYEILNREAVKGQILFTGSSLMEMFPVCEIAESRGFRELIYNRGVGGLNTDEFLERIHTLLLDLEPSRVFLNIGTNDITEERLGSRWMNHLLENYRKVLRIVRASLPDCRICVMAYYPANLHLPWQTEESKEWMQLRTPEVLARCNRELRKMTKEEGCFFLDCNEALTDENGEQKQEYAIDGVHMYANGYLKVFDCLLPFLREPDRMVP